MISRPLSRDEFRGTTTMHHFDPVTKDSYVETVMDVEPLAEANQRLRNETDKHTKHGEFALAFRLPPHVFYDLVAKGIYVEGDPKNLRFALWLEENKHLYGTRNQRYV